jgi:hypothetical protein
MSWGIGPMVILLLGMLFAPGGYLFGWVEQVAQLFIGTGQPEHVVNVFSSRIVFLSLFVVAFIAWNLQRQLQESAEFTKGQDEGAEKKFTEIKDTIEELGKKMRENVDYIFNANVSEMCASDGSMSDPINGAFRFEHIIDTISKLYENNLNAEFEKMRSRVNRKVTQYTKKKKH